jgi:hypothetical protein
MTEVPETALTAVTVEALAPGKSAEERAAIERACEFLFRRQLRTWNMPAPLDPDLGAALFKASRESRDPRAGPSRPSRQASNRRWSS